MKLIFLEVVHQALYSGKVWGNRFFLFCIRLVGPYSKPFLNSYLYVISDPLINIFVSKALKLFEPQRASLLTYYIE